jgi:hypothetical protein
VPRSGATVSLLSLLGAVVLRPNLWVEGSRTVLRFARPQWWRQWPPIPRPPDDYLAFRIQTQSGNPDESLSHSGQMPEAADLVAFLKWTRSHRQVLG